MNEISKDFDKKFVLKKISEQYFDYVIIILLLRKNFIKDCKNVENVLKKC